MKKLTICLIVFSLAVPGFLLATTSTVTATTTSQDSVNERSILPEQLLDWAEGTYPQFFPNHQETQLFHNLTLTGYPEYFSYRYYPETDIYLATDEDSSVWLLSDDLTNGIITKIGEIEDYRDRVLQLSSTYSIPVDLAAIEYPDSYRKTTTMASDQVSDACQLDRSVIAVPKGWVDSRPLPQIIGAPLNSDIVRGVSIKDIGNPDNPAFVLEGAPDAPNGCSGDQKTEITRTLQRLKDLGTDIVFMPYWHWISKDASGQWFFTEADETFGAISDENLRYFAQEARRFGLQLVMFQQAQGMVDDWMDRGYTGLGRYQGPAYVPERTIDNVQNLLRAHSNYMLNRASFFQEIGVTYWDLGCDGCVFPDWSLTDEELPLYYASYRDLYEELRSIYTGKLMLNGSLVYRNQDFADLADVLVVSMMTNRISAEPLTSQQESTLSADQVAEAYTQALQYDIDYYSRYNKEIMVHGAAWQSRSDVLSFPGYIEESNCTSSTDYMSAPSFEECIQKDVVPDFALQAVIIEGFFRALSTIDNSTPLSVLLDNYWQTDNLLPQTAFPNIGESFRNKPAEAIVRSWYAR